MLPSDLWSTQGCAGIWLHGTSRLLGLFQPLECFVSRQSLPGPAANASPLAHLACKRLCPASPRLAPQAAAAVCLEFTRERQEARRLEDIQRGKGDEEDEGELREQLEDLGELEQDIAQVLQLDEAPQQQAWEEQREPQEPQPKRSAGRPRKSSRPEGEEQQRPKRTPGRPRKVQQPLERQLDEVESKEEEQQ